MQPTATPCCQHGQSHHTPCSHHVHIMQSSFTHMLPGASCTYEVHPHVSHCPFACAHAHAASRELHPSARAAVSAIITAVAHQKHLTRYQSHSCSTVECMQLPMATAQHSTAQVAPCVHALTCSHAAPVCVLPWLACCRRGVSRRCRGPGLSRCVLIARLAYAWDHATRAV